MICPRCQQDRVDPKSGDCRNCGHRLSSAETLDLPGAAELERQIDKLLGKEFQLEGPLGRGGMSVVYLANERRLNRLVALKILPFQMVLGTPALDRFEREAKIAASLDHPHIVPIYNTGSTSSFMWISMKYIKGRSLAELLEETGPVALDVALDILGQIASALQHAHHCGVIHRDIKPENVMIDGHGWAWLSDFGVAKAFGNTPLTQTGGTMGTPGYMSPEQCYSQPMDGRTDEYSLAILAFRCLGGRLPFEADSLGEMVAKHCLEPPPSLDTFRAGLPPRIALSIIKAMAKKREERYDNVLQFVEAMGGRVSLQVARQSLRALVQAAPEGGAPGVPPTRGDQVPATQEATAVTASAAHPPGTSWRPSRRAALIAGGGALAVAAVALWNPAQAPERSGLDAPVTNNRTEIDAVRRDSPIAANPAPAAAVSRPIPRPRRARPAVLWVFSVPVADLYLGDSLLGSTNLPYGGLRAGQYGLKIRRDGYESADRTITLTAGDTSKVTDIALRQIRP